MRIGIDLGTANSLVWVQGKGIVLSEPTVVAVSVDTKNPRVVAVGTQARNMLGRTPGNILASKPLRGGVIADYVVTEALLRTFLHQVTKARAFFRPQVMISVPAGSTQVERRAVLDATLSAGAGSAYLIDAPLAAIIGAGVAIGEASGNMVLDIGGGAAEAAVVSLGGVVVSKSTRVGGNALDEAIAKHVRRTYRVSIGDQMAETIKISIGAAATPPSAPNEKLEVKGRDTVQGLPREVTLTTQEVMSALHKPLEDIVSMVKKVLENVPPELASDIIDKGIVLTGGSAQLRWLDRYLTDEIGVPVSVASDPMTCVIRGIGMVLDDIDTYRHALYTRG